MSYKKLIPCLYIKNQKAVKGIKNQEVLEENPLSLACHLGDNGADALLIFDLSDGDTEHEESLDLIKDIFRLIDIPLYCGGNVKRAEDVKKILYTGAKKAILNFGQESNIQLLEEVSKRFGRDKIAVSVKDIATLEKNVAIIEEYASEVIIWCENSSVELFADKIELPVIAKYTDIDETAILDTLKQDSIMGVAADSFSNTEMDFIQVKEEGRNKEIPMNMVESKLKWADFKLNADGMLPVVVQDYKTDEVLMLAYINEEAFEATVRTGKMTYYSRSRKKLWVKGLTSGHYQYVKSLTADCDFDTILAKVSQVGAACHTGNKTCFFNEILKKDFEEKNPLTVLLDVYKVIEDRKKNPKEGSYTNYLFDKGIDKILKKLGEEATEIVIAAKNPNPEEIKYEISDFLYHAMVLMSLKGVTWEDIMKELANR